MVSRIAGCYHPDITNERPVPFKPQLWCTNEQYAKVQQALIHVSDIVEHVQAAPAGMPAVTAIERNFVAQVLTKKNLRLIANQAQKNLYFTPRAELPDGCVILVAGGLRGGKREVEVHEYLLNGLLQKLDSEQLTVRGSHFMDALRDVTLSPEFVNKFEKRIVVDALLERSEVFRGLQRVSCPLASATGAFARNLHAFLCQGCCPLTPPPPLPSPTVRPRGLRHDAPRHRAARGAARGAACRLVGFRAIRREPRAPQELAR